MFPDKSEPAEDRQLAEALERSGNVTLGYLPRVGAQDGEYQRRPTRCRNSPSTRELGVDRAATTIMPTKSGTCRTAVTGDGRIIPSLRVASWQARTAEPTAISGSIMRFDPDIDSDDQRRRCPGRPDCAEPARGQDGRSSASTVERLGDQFIIPGCGKAGGVYIHIIGAETLKAGMPVDLGWLPAFLLARCVGRCLAICARAAGRRRPCSAAHSSLLLAVPILLEAHPDLRRHHRRPVRHHLGRDRPAWRATPSAAA